MIRIAASTYLNSAPLVYSFAQGRFSERYRFIGDAAPSRCAAMLASGECEIALIPVIEYQRIPGLRLIPGVAVASRQRVRSVLIASRCPLREVRTLALDTSSRTSQTLVKILFRHAHGFLPEFIEQTPDPAGGYENMLATTDAALVIGDPAMRVEASAAQWGVTIYDLAAEWRKMTGLPFVFAVWAIRADAVDDESSIVRDFLLARQEGIGRLAELAASYSRDLNLPAADLLDYLRNNVNYDLDEENLTGMRQYFALAYRYRLISENRPLSFLTPTSRHAFVNHAGGTPAVPGG